MSEDDNVHNFNKASICLFLTTNIFLQEKQVSEFFSFCKLGRILYCVHNNACKSLQDLKSTGTGSTKKNEKVSNQFCRLLMS